MIEIEDARTAKRNPKPRSGTRSPALPLCGSSERQARIGRRSPHESRATRNASNPSSQRGRTEPSVRCAGLEGETSSQLASGAGMHTVAGNTARRRKTPTCSSVRNSPRMASGKSPSASARSSILFAEAIEPMTNKTETPMIPMIQVAPDFPRARYAESCYSKRLGKFLAMLQCEELIEGRWEPFCSVIGCDGTFYEPFNLGPFSCLVGAQGERKARTQ